MTSETRDVEVPGACEVIEAIFRYGPVRCGAQTNTQVYAEGWFYTCAEHLLAGAS